MLNSLIENKELEWIVHNSQECAAKSKIRLNGRSEFPLTLGGAGVGPINVINENNLHGFSLYGVEFYMLSVNINNMFES